MIEHPGHQWREEGDRARLPPLARFDHDDNEHSSIEGDNHWHDESGCPATDSQLDTDEKSMVTAPVPERATSDQGLGE